MSDIPREPAPEDEVPLETEDATETEGDEDVEAGDGDEPETGDGEDEAEDADAEDVDAAPAPRRGGGSPAVRRQRARAQAAERENAELKRRLDELSAGHRDLAARIQQDPQAAARAEAEWLAQLEMMTPAQQAQAIQQRIEQRVSGALQGIQFQTNDRLDKQAYETAARSSQIHQRYRDRVEDVLRSERAQGRNPDREVILDYLVGRDVREKASRAAPKQRAQAAARVNGQQTRPTGARGDSAAGPRRPAPGTPEHDEWLVNQAIARGERVF